MYVINLVMVVDKRAVHAGRKIHSTYEGDEQDPAVATLHYDTERIAKAGEASRYCKVGLSVTLRADGEW